MKRKASNCAACRSDMGRACVKTRVKPRHKDIVAKVAIKGCSFPKLTKTPLKRPKTVPVNKTTITAGTRFQPLNRSEAPIALVKARIEPMDKSMPPIRMVKLIPTASTALIDVCKSTVRRLLIVKKTGLAKDITITIKASTIKGLLLCKIENTRSFLLIFCIGYRFPHGQGHDLLLIGLITFQKSRNLTFMHHHDAIGHTQYFFNFR